MLTENQANRLMRRLISLRKEFEDTGDYSILDKLKKHEESCMQKFRYLITMHTAAYRNFGNYDDLNQEGYVALVNAMKTFRLGLGSFFYWAHKYIGTRISRAANTHCVIRYPLKYAKKNPPRKESKMPTVVEKRISFCPEKSFEEVETVNAIENAMEFLNRRQKKIIKIYYGLTGDKGMSISKICKKMKMSRTNTIKTLNDALDLLKQNIRI